MSKPKLFQILLFLIVLIIFFGPISFVAESQAPTGDLIIKKSPPKEIETKEVLTAESIPAEYRFMWVTRYQLQSTENVDLIIKRAKKYNFNALFIQICALGEAFYHSKIDPWGKGVSKEFDPLAELIRKAKKEKIEVHAWINTAFIWGNINTPQNKKHVLNQHPEWVLKDKKGKSMQDYSAWEKKWARVSGIYLDLSIPQVQNYLTALFLEVVRKYKVDGLHFDYIRYPGDRFGYSEAAAEAFQNKYKVDPRALVLNKGIAIKVFGKERYKELLEMWDAFRCQQVSALIARVQKEAMKIRPDIKISAAVVADIDRAKNNYFQDWEAWLRAGIVDFVVPMSYSQRNDLVQRQISVAVQMAENYGRGVIIGLGAWRQDPKKIAEKILFTRKVREKMGFKKLLGVSLFSYDSMIKDNEYLLELRREVFPTKAKVPQLSWQENKIQDSLAEDISSASISVSIN